MLWLYDWKLSEYRCQSPFNTTKENNFYTSIDENGEKDLRVEHFLSDIEGKAKVVISELRNGKQIDLQGITDLALFVGFMYSRIPAFKKMYSDGADKVMKAVMKMSVKDERDAERFINNPEVDPKYVLDFFQNEKYKITQHQNVLIDAILRMADTVFQQIYNQDWVILSCDSKRSFVTSDAPVTLYPTKSYNPRSTMGAYGVATPGVEKRIPLAQDLFLVCLDKGNKVEFRKAGSLGVRHLNLYTASHSQRFLIARDRPLLESLVEAVRDHRAQGYEVTVGLPAGGAGGIGSFMRGPLLPGDDPGAPERQ